MSSGKKQTTLGRFFTLPPGTDVAVPIQSKLRAISTSSKPIDNENVASLKVEGTSSKPADNENVASPKVEGTPVKGTAAKRPKSSPDNKRPKKQMVASYSGETSSKPGSSSRHDEVDSGSEAEKPSLPPAAGREMLKKLAGDVPPAYSDWDPGKPTPYAALVTTFKLLEGTTKRLEKISHTSRFLRQVLRLSPDELLLVVHLMINKLAADFEGVEMGVGESLLMKAIGESCGRSLDKIREDHRECGDLGLVAMKSRNNQLTIFAPQPLTVAVVHKGLLDIAKVKGEGGQGRKVSAIRKLLAAAKGDEAKFLIRGLEGKLRLGLADRTVLVSLSSAFITHERELKGQKPNTAMLDEAELNLRSVYSELPSYEIIIPAIREHGIINVKQYCKLQPGVPVKPMLAKPTKAISEVLDRFENRRFTCEYKYDGERAQIHYVSPKSSIEYPPATLGGEPIKNLAKVFSRNSEDLSGKYPDILAAMNNWVRPEVESFVLDCEAVGLDEINNRLLPFQMLQTRKRKDVALEDVKIRVCVHAFDLLFLNGKPVVRESLSDRRKLMHETFIEVPNQFVFARYMDSSNLEEITVFLDQSVKDSCEGLMVKMMDGRESFYEPSQRSRNWLKIKKDYIDALGDSLDLVVIGAYWGKGKRTSVYGSFLLACYNLGTQSFESVCNIGTGFSEAELEEFYETLHPLEIDRAKPFYDHPNGNAGKPDVWFEPKVVWEVKAADLTLSPRYRAAAGLAGHRDKGVSLRFPRFIGPRTDKSGDDATSSSQIAEMYLRQDQVANKSAAKGVDDNFEY
ncbi:ATP-dependent DNA ligase [Choiromyces venosus 120613-1]|uniref:DNA ligase n=1 Tax=Choiromyces venosus 120613-1 TaxID=1336337 RepID=A0A3N4J4W7_9PEZI|nr:ATP-dependent DNA ligase [Choiromyces venosus 120613-1]